MFVAKRRVSRREFLRLGGAGLAGAGLLLGGAALSRVVPVAEDL